MKESKNNNYKNDSNMKQNNEEFKRINYISLYEKNEAEKFQSMIYYYSEKTFLIF